MKILIIRMSALGDVAMTVPAVRAYALAHPDAEIHVLTRQQFSSLYTEIAPNIIVIPVDIKSRAYKTLGGWIKTAYRLTKGGYDATYDLHNVLRSWIVDVAMVLAGGKVHIVSKSRSSRKKIIKGKLCAVPMIEKYSTMLDVIDAAPALSQTRNKLIGIAPFARYSNKVYPIELCEEVVAQLSANGYEVLLFGGRGSEKQILESWADKYQGCTSVAGKFDLSEELNIMSTLGVILSMDSANQHLAALAGVPVITIWGSTTPACGFIPWNHNTSRDVVCGLPCQPCTIAGSNQCEMHESDAGFRKFECLRMVNPADVVNKIIKVVEKDAK